VYHYLFLQAKEEEEDDEEEEEEEEEEEVASSVGAEASFRLDHNETIHRPRSFS